MKWIHFHNDVDVWGVAQAKAEYRPMNLFEGRIV